MTTNPTSGGAILSNQRPSPPNNNPRNSPVNPMVNRMNSPPNTITEPIISDKGQSSLKYRQGGGSQ